MRAAPRNSLPEGWPPFPDRTVIPPVVIPPPPPLDPDASPAESARRMAIAYKRACEQVVARPCWPYSRQQAQSAGTNPILLAAVPLLLEARVAPESWCAWSVDVWCTYAARPTASGGIPPLRWVYSSSRFERRVGWFRHEDQIGTRLFVGSKTVDLVRRYKEACRQLRLSGDDPTMAQKILAQFFPEGYQTAVQTATEEADALRQSVARQLSDGSWLW